METTISLLPCKALDETLEFYRTLGFEITYEQTSPYLYGAVRRGEVSLHFASLTVYGAKNAFGACLVFVNEVEQYHRAFADALRAKYGKVPTAGVPRISRYAKGQTRFKLFDPTGNLLIYIDYKESDAAYWESDTELSALAQALENAVFLRDTYANDQAAAKVLDYALARNEPGAPIDRARVLAARAELAVALGETARAETIRSELAQIPMEDDERARFRDELEAAERLERWLTQRDGTADER